MFSFVTKQDILWIRILCKGAEFSVWSFFQKHDYQIEPSEAFSILWPPVYTRDSCSICAGDIVYAHSSFELIPHGNMNVDGTFAKEVSRDVLKLHINDEVIIHEKNIDICIQRENGKGNSLEEPMTTYSEDTRRFQPVRLLSV